MHYLNIASLAISKDEFSKYLEIGIMKKGYI